MTQGRLDDQRGLEINGETVQNRSNKLKQRPFFFTEQTIFWNQFFKNYSFLLNERF